LFADEMLAAFEDLLADRSPAAPSLLRIALRELRGLIAGAAAQWCAAIACAAYRRASLAQPFSLPAEYAAKLATVAYRSNPSFGGRLCPDRRAMRPPGVRWDEFYGR